jgi:hypothetical protein
MAAQPAASFPHNGGWRAKSLLSFQGRSERLCNPTPMS